MEPRPAKEDNLRSIRYYDFQLAKLDFRAAIHRQRGVAVEGIYTVLDANDQIGFAVAKIDWGNYAECLPSLLIIAGIPLCFSIADGLALGFIAYPLVKLFSGQGRDVKWLMYVMAVVLVVYFIMIPPGV